MTLPRVLCADPAWLFKDKLPGPKRGASKHYGCMSTKDICRLAIPQTEPDSVLFLWRVSSQVEEALQVVRAWHYTPKSEIVWRKCFACSCGWNVESALPATDDERCPLCAKSLTRWFGMGWSVRAEHETCIIATRGKAAGLRLAGNVRSVFTAPADKSVNGHSRKPEAFYTLVERLYPGPYVELFARRERPGWTCVGDSLGTRLEPRVDRQLALFGDP